MAWSTSDRLSRLPANWKSLRAKVLQRDRYECQWRGCGAPANQVDHIDRNGGDGMENLQSLCQYHHARKSAAEGHAASAEFRKKLKHPSTREKGPGAIHPRDAVPRKYKGF